MYRVTAIALLVALLFLPGCGSLGSGSSASTSTQVEVEKEYARFPRFQNRKVTQDNRVLTLTNWKKSPFHLIYTLSVDGESIYESPVLLPGEKLDWDILAYCAASCDLEITATAYTPEGEEQNSVTQTIHLTLPKTKKESKAEQTETKQTEPASSQTEGEDVT